MVIPEIERLIRDLDSPSDDTAEEAQASLTELGALVPKCHHQLP